jgi:hypothetical protein
MYSVISSHRVGLFYSPLLVMVGWCQACKMQDVSPVSAKLQLAGLAPLSLQEKEVIDGETVARIVAEEPAEED